MTGQTFFIDFVRMFRGSPDPIIRTKSLWNIYKENVRMFLFIDFVRMIDLSTPCSMLSGAGGSVLGGGCRLG